jgi:hypothetical protein
VQATLGALFDVAGFRADPLPEVNFAVWRARPTLYLRARGPVTGAYRFTPFIVTREGAPRVFDRGNATQLWYPTDEWPAGTVVRLPLPPLTYGPGDRLGIGAQTGAGPETRRLPAGGGSAPPADGGRVAVLGELP